MDIYGERTIIPAPPRDGLFGAQLIERNNWIDITTNLVGLGTSDKEGQTLHYQVHTYPTTKHENITHREASRPKHYVTEVTLNGKWYEWTHYLYFNKKDGIPSLEKTLIAIRGHFGVVNTIRTQGPRAFWEQCNPEGGMFG